MTRFTPPPFAAAFIFAAGGLAACAEPFVDAAADAGIVDEDNVLAGVALNAYVPTPRALTSVPDDCASALRVDGACRAFRGTFTGIVDGDEGTRDFVLDDDAPPAVFFATRFGAPFEQSVQVLFRTDPRRRSSEGPTGSLNLTLAIGAATEARTFLCADGDPLNIDPDDAIDADKIVMNRDLYQLSVVYHPPVGDSGGLASTYDDLPDCTLQVDELPVGGAGRFRGTLAATFTDRAGNQTALTDGAFDIEFAALELQP